MLQLIPDLSIFFFNLSHIIYLKYITLFYRHFNFWSNSIFQWSQMFVLLLVFTSAVAVFLIGYCYWRVTFILFPNFIHEYFGSICTLMSSWRIFINLQGWLFYSDSSFWKPPQMKVWNSQYEISSVFNICCLYVCFS